MSKRAVILAGGKGSRLKPYTTVLPKPLMPVGEFSILEIIIRQLVKNKFDHITLAVNHQADIIKAFFNDGSKWGIKIDYSLEDKPLSTIAPLTLIKDLPEDFLVMNGDILTDLDYGVFYQNHCAEKNIFTISSYQREQQVDYGVLETNQEKILTNFKEKPKYKLEVSMGIYMVNKKILNFVPANTAYGFDHLMYDLLKSSHPVKTQIHSGYWLDIGRPDDYLLAIEEFDKLKSKFL